MQAVNRYVFRTGVRALEGLEEEGAGELLEGRGEDVKSAIMGSVPPAPSSTTQDRRRCPPSRTSCSPALPDLQQLVGANSAPSAQPHSAPIDAWRVVPSTPSPTIATCGEVQASHSGRTMGTLGFEAVQLPSPTPSFSQPCDASSPYTSSSYYSPPPAVGSQSPPFPLPSVLAQQCGSSAINAGYGGFGWDTGFAPQYAAFT